MKNILLFIIMLVAAVVSETASAQNRVRGYTRRDGTQVQSYERSAPNAYRWDNRGYRPTQDPYNDSYRQPTRNYGSGWTQPNPNRFLDSNPSNDVNPGYAVPRGATNWMGQPTESRRANSFGL